MQNKRFRTRLVRAGSIGLLAVASIAHAAPVTADIPEAIMAMPADIPHGERTTAEELTRLQEQTILLQARLRMLEARAEVTARTQALTQMGDSAAAGGRVAVPRVLSIEGLNNHFAAVLQTADGERFEVKTGDTLPDGLHVASIASNQVVVRQGTRSLQLVPSLDADMARLESANAPAVPVPLPSSLPSPARFAVQGVGK